MLNRAADIFLWVLYGVFWIAAGWGKAVDVPQFAISVSAYQILPTSWVDPLAYAMVSAEVAAGVLIAVSRTRAAGCGLALGLLAVFTSAVARALYRGEFHECGCKIPLIQGTTVGPHLLFRNLLLGAWGVFLLYRHSGSRRREGLGRAAAPLWEGRWRIAQVVLILCLTVTTLYQKGINAKIIREGGYSPSGGFSNRSPMEAGVKLPSFQGALVGAPAGTRHKVAFGPGEPPCVVILFKSSCTACALSAPAWNAWFAREGGAKGGEEKGKMRFVGICTSDPDSSRRFAERYKILFPVINVDPQTWAEFRTSVVPKILKVSGEGVVTEVRATAP